MPESNVRSLANRKACRKTRSYQLYLEDTQKQLAWLLCQQKWQKPTWQKQQSESNTDVQCCWTDAGDEQQSMEWESHRDAQQVVSNAKPVMPNSLSASRGFWSSPHPCHHLNIYSGTAGRGFCYFILFAFCFSFCLSFQRCGLTAVTGVNRHWPLPCGQDIILLSLAQWRSSGHKLIRAPPCQRCKERQPPNPGERHHLRWQTLYCNHSRPGNKIMS